jgi:hypothetical protein
VTSGVELVTQTGVGEQSPRYCLAAFVYQRENQMFDAHKVVLQRLGLFFGIQQDAVQTLSHVELVIVRARASHVGTTIKLRLDLSRQNLRIDGDSLKKPRQQTVLLLDQRQQQMLSVNFIICEPRRYVLCLEYGIP